MTTKSILTEQQEIAGLKCLCESWRKDCKSYQAALKAVRQLAEPFVDSSGILAAIHDFCDKALKHELPERNKP